MMNTPEAQTMLGAIGAMLAFALIGMPEETPKYVSYILGIANAGLVFHLGKSHPGRK